MLFCKMYNLIKSNINLEETDILEFIGVFRKLRPAPPLSGGLLSKVEVLDAVKLIIL